MSLKRKNQLEIEKTKLKPSQTEKTEPNRFEVVFVLKKANRIEADRFKSVLVFFKKISV
jgi:hypothetical protein